jgi:hypothetical protein
MHFERELAAERPLVSESVMGRNLKFARKFLKGSNTLGS